MLYTCKISVHGIVPKISSKSNGLLKYLFRIIKLIASSYPNQVYAFFNSLVYYYIRCTSNFCIALSEQRVSLLILLPTKTYRWLLWRRLLKVKQVKPMLPILIRCQNIGKKMLLWEESSQWQLYQLKTCLQWMF